MLSVGYEKDGFAFLIDGFELSYWYQNGSWTRFKKSSSSLIVVISMKGLFKYYVKVVELVRPRYFVMENVPNLLTAENGYFQKEIIDLFNGMGYDLNMGILNAADYGVPQNRRRAVIIGKRDGKAPALPKKAEQRDTIWDAISDLAFLESGEGQEKQEYVNTPTSDYEKSLRGDAQVLYNHVATKHSKLVLERLVIRSISPALHFSIISRKCSRCRTEVPEMPSSANMPANSHSGFS